MVAGEFKAEVEDKACRHFLCWKEELLEFLGKI
jgi:hypothetical protein